MPKEIFGRTYYNMKEVADILGISHRTVGKYRERGNLQGVRVGKEYLFTDEQIKDFLQGGNTKKR